MDRPPPSDTAASSTDRSSGARPEAPAPPRALRHYDHAIEALAGTTYGGLSATERRALLASLCREKRRLVSGTPDGA